MMLQKRRLEAQGHGGQTAAPKVEKFYSLDKDQNESEDDSPIPKAQQQKRQTKDVKSLFNFEIEISDDLNEDPVEPDQVEKDFKTA